MKKLHQSDYCMQTSVLKLSDTTQGTNTAIAIHFLLAFFRGLLSLQAFTSERGTDQRSHSNMYS